LSRRTLNHFIPVELGERESNGSQSPRRWLYRIHARCTV